MILICGIPSEPPLAKVIEALNEIGVPYAVFNQRHFAAMDMTFEIHSGEVSGRLEIQGSSFPLEDIRGIYTRQMDFRLLPELKDRSEASDEYRYCAALHDTLTRWCEISSARVVNRVAPMGSNSSKPYQAQLIRRYGFEAPETLITNDPEQVLEFRNRHKKIIYKSISGVRSIVQVFDDEDLSRLASLRWCPTQFQQLVEGVDVRVHTICDKVIATRITSSATDYRYAKTQVGESAELTATELPDEVSANCVRLASGLGLAFAGIDLRFAPDGRVFCFEVNPCPGYTYFEANSGQPIARSVAHYLAGDA
jgi:hypothetical protein